ncbi:Ribonuclease H-like superfamily [Sesbania bispinosa]|nr:Ribonuclease H-like superfamily [Sesbania bispinosa]
MPFWMRSSPVSLKLNVDGSCLGQGIMGTRGLVRNHLGEWIIGFSSKEGQGDAQLAELLALKHDLEVAWSNGYRDLVCECDALEVVDVVLGNSDHNFHRHAGGKHLC